MKKIAVILSCIIIGFIQCSKNGSSGGSTYNHERAVGASANDLFSAAKYTSLKIEIQYMTGFQPDAAAIDHMVNFLNNRLNKPGGFTIVQKEIPAGANTTLTSQDIINLDKQYRTVFTSGSQLGIYFLYTNGNYTSNNVLGLAYRNTSMCIFGKAIGDNSGGLNQVSRTKLTATVMEHEFGHIMGLVNIGTPMQIDHQDASSGAHCMNYNCLMYYASETTDILGFLLTGNIPTLDANCVNDCKANGGK